jgi:hypothetical protein
LTQLVHHDGQGANERKSVSFKAQFSYSIFLFVDLGIGALSLSVEVTDRFGRVFTHPFNIDDLKPKELAGVETDAMTIEMLTTTKVGNG